MTVKLNMTSRFEPKVPAYNISGEIPGADPGAGVLIVGGHLDSWDAGTGAVDDAAGIAITTAAAKLAASQGPLKRTLRVVMWGSEEQGGSSEAYLAAHRDEVAQMVVVGESDSGAGRVWQARLPKGSLDHPAMQAFRATIAPLKVIVSREAPRFGGADVSGLISAGAVRGVRPGRQPLLRSAPLRRRHAGQDRPGGAVAERGGLGRIPARGGEQRHRFPGAGGEALRPPAAAPLRNGLP
ncbi:M20/M25/M40 family metallo-hydrolase [Phenylobacterium sp. J426]|uniref:M20/M25/M40 family metallo-hydrolase n=1 Tax=Phenylobacterium sp. J426 TaxID=2898439 RepID=UPI0027E352C7|nr:M20/M25/M40 family metallo-hydrolase [Phenylobacterium sp. J426]